MEFTISFIKLFSWTIYLVSPLLLFFILLIIFLSQIVKMKENWTIFDAVYWSFITATTVGYGDIRPLKKVSKTLSILIVLIGVMFTGIIIAVTLNTTSVVIEKHLDKSIIEKMKRI